MKTKVIKLNDGNKIPQIGLGTWRIVGKENVKSVLRKAILAGYRHIDTAYVYENEKDIGEALSEFYKEGIIKREDLFITSKLWNSFHERPDEAISQSLKDLQTDYLDLYLIHWPVHFDINEDGTTKRYENGDPVLKPFKVFPLWNKMEEFKQKGLVKSIGVSNLGVENLTILLKDCKIKPSMCQYEMHPYLKQRELTDFCFKNEIKVTAYSSLGSLASEEGPKILSDPVLQKVASAKNVSVSIVILSWLVQKNIVIIPKATSEEHLKENLIYVELSDKEMNEIENIDTEYRYVVVKGFGPDSFK